MKEEIPNGFWEKWYKTIDRPKLLRQLPLKYLTNKLKTGINIKLDLAMEHSINTLINSYLEDLMLWIQDKEKKDIIKDIESKANKEYKLKHYVSARTLKKLSIQLKK